MTSKPSILIIEGRFYTDINDELLKGTIAALEANDCDYEHIVVPGALEIPVALAIAIEADQMGPDRKHQGCVALGCVIRGETSHYDIVANESARGLMQLAMEEGLPLGNAILTVDTGEQARVRAAHNGKNKGGDAVAACLALLRQADDYATRESS
jgi:6,7-dimethyl-8-ribityllumazine synthase